MWALPVAAQLYRLLTGKHYDSPTGMLVLTVEAGDQILKSHDGACVPVVITECSTLRVTMARLSLL